MRTLRCFSAPTYTAVLPPGHVFPMEKFGQSADLVRTFAQVIDPGLIPLDDLHRAHTLAYVESIRAGRYNERTALKLGLPWHPTLWTRSRAATAGTLAAARAALADGLACNLAGGTHHAFADSGEGFCVFNDVAVAVRALQRDEPLLQVFVADLDAHQGNGTHALLAAEPGVFCYSLHVGRNYPSAKVPGDLDVPLARWAGADEYFDALTSTLPAAIERFEPDLVFYNAGVDVHERDRFGQMRLTTEDMGARDDFVLDLCRDWEVPTCVVYGGGYHAHRPMTGWLHARTVHRAAVRFARERGERASEMPEAP